MILILIEGSDPLTVDDEDFEGRLTSTPLKGDGLGPDPESL